MRDTLTLALNGEVPLPEFAQAIGHLDDLVRALSNELVSDTAVEWVIDRLESGSAIATVRGYSETPEAVSKIVQAYETVGTHLQTNTPIPYSAKVSDSAHALTKVLNGKITSLRFETANQDIVISGQRQLTSKKPSYSYGTLKGTVQTLSRRRGVQFTLYDALLDRPISCYLKEGDEDLIRDKWGKKVLVSGLIGRDNETGRPFAVRQVTSIREYESNPGSYARARGVLKLPEGDTPESVIRELRDGYG